MSSENWSPVFGDQNLTATELLTDHRKRLAVEEEDRVRKRISQLEELRSEFNSVSARIRAWEKMHGLRLPADPSHPILDVISSVTGIPLAALWEEQQARPAKAADATGSNGQSYRRPDLADSVMLDGKVDGEPTPEVREESDSRGGLLPARSC
jgi:hypothetical protein